MKSLQILFTLVFATYTWSIAQATEAPYYNNKEAAEIAQCIRSEIKHAPAPTIADLQVGSDWVCQQLIYLWDHDKNVNVLVVRDDFNNPVFNFAANDDTDTDLIFNNSAAHGDAKAQFGAVDHKYLTGFFSYLGLGPAPHRQDFVTFNNGYLLWEESVKNADYNLPLIPALTERPIAIFRDYPGTPAAQKHRVTTYGICRIKDMPAANAPCFN